jgi:hypothetical protein
VRACDRDRDVSVVHAIVSKTCTQFDVDRDMTHLRVTMWDKEKIGKPNFLGQVRVCDHIVCCLVRVCLSSRVAQVCLPLGTVQPPVDPARPYANTVNWYPVRDRGEKRVWRDCTYHESCTIATAAC